MCNSIGTYCPLKKKNTKIQKNSLLNIPFCAGELLAVCRFIVI